MDPQKFCYALTSILRPCLAEYYIMEVKEVRQISTWNAEKFIICSGQEMHLGKIIQLSYDRFFFLFPIVCFCITKQPVVKLCSSLIP